VVIYRYLTHGAGRQAADDLPAATFLAAFGRPAGYDRGRADARPWFCGIASNSSAAGTATTSGCCALSRAGVDTGGGRRDGPDRAVNASTVGRAAAAALAELPAADRDVLLLFAWASLGYAEIAQPLELPAGTVRSGLHRASPGPWPAPPADACAPRSAPTAVGRSSGWTRRRSRCGCLATRRHRRSSNAPDASRQPSSIRATRRRPGLLAHSRPRRPNGTAPSAAPRRTSPEGSVSRSAGRGRRVRQEILFDPATGAYIGEREASPHGGTGVPAGMVTTSTAVTVEIVDSTPGGPATPRARSVDRGALGRLTRLRPPDGGWVV
jgi:RNA polymerase sigma-70 factor (ECF subfamily)